MEKRTLPNATAVLVLGILSILTCCCYGIIGLILGIIALVLAGKDMKLYRESPELYSNYQNLNIGKILSIIGVVLSSITFLVFIFLFSLGEERLKEIQQNLEEKVKYEQEQ
ncbi:MAG: CCC motif membrane protein [Flavobacterium sp.]